MELGENFPPKHKHSGKGQRPNSGMEKARPLPAASFLAAGLAVLKANHSFFHRKYSFLHRLVNGTALLLGLILPNRSALCFKMKLSND
ncbi:MAG: hypothetical protein HFG06_06400 [Oscillibacter sp.]|nr:hypothetical protein [Oscillibacter sp.]